MCARHVSVASVTTLTSVSAKRKIKTGNKKQEVGGWTVKVEQLLRVLSENEGIQRVVFLVKGKDHRRYIGVGSVEDIGHSDSVVVLGDGNNKASVLMRELQETDYGEFELEFSLMDGFSKFLNIRKFEVGSTVERKGNVIVLTGEEL